MRKTSSVLTAITLCGVLTITAGAAEERMEEKLQTYTNEQVAHGEYLVRIIGCNDCHTPLVMSNNGPVPDMSRMLSGHPESLTMPSAPQLPEGPWVWVGAGTNTAYSGPWGTSYATNLTPDENTGMGTWTEEIFLNTIRSGRHWGVARPIMPPMPWQSFSQMTDDDLKAIFAYLKTIAPIKNRVPDAVAAGEPADPNELDWDDAAASIEGKK